MHSPKPFLLCAGLLFAAGLSSGAWAGHGDHANATDDKDRHEKHAPTEHTGVHHDASPGKPQDQAPPPHTAPANNQNNQGNHQNPHHGGQSGNNGGVRFAPQPPAVQAAPPAHSDTRWDGHVDRGHDGHAGHANRGDWHTGINIDVHLGERPGSHAWHHVWGAGDIRHFREHDWDDWHRGGWHHAWYNDRFGWWWVVSGVWFFYPQPVYPYPDPYIPPDYAGPPMLDDGQPAMQYWYYCAAQDGYYPYVPSCPTGWTQVPGVDPTVQQSAPPPAPAPQQQTQYWYFCPQSNTYYPYVSSCPAGWQQVPATAPADATPDSTPPADAGTPPPGTPPPDGS